MNYYEYSNQIISKYVWSFITTAIATIILIIMEIALLKGVAIYLNKKNSFFILLKERDFYFNLLAIIVVTLCLLLAISGIICAFRDIPYLINGNFKSTIGIVVSQDASGREDISEDRTFKLQDIKSCEIVELRVFYTPIRSGEVYEVIYLPYTRCGTIVRKIE